MTRGHSSSASSPLKLQTFSPSSRLPRPRNCPQSPVPSAHASQTPSKASRGQVPSAKNSGSASDVHIPRHIPLPQPGLWSLSVVSRSEGWAQSLVFNLSPQQGLRVKPTPAQSQETQEPCSDTKVTLPPGHSPDLSGCRLLSGKWRSDSSQDIVSEEELGKYRYRAVQVGLLSLSCCWC